MARAVRDGGSPWKRTAFRCIAVLATVVLAAGGMQGFAVTASAEDMAGRTESMDGGGSTGQSGDVDDGTGAGVKTGGSDDASEPLFTEDFEGSAQDGPASDGTRLQDYRSSWNGQDVRYAADGDRPNPEECGGLIAGVRFDGGNGDCTPQAASKIQAQVRALGGDAAGDGADNHALTVRVGGDPARAGGDAGRESLLFRTSPGTPVALPDGAQGSRVRIAADVASADGDVDPSSLAFQLDEYDAGHQLVGTVPLGPLSESGSSDRDEPVQGGHGADSEKVRVRVRRMAGEAHLGGTDADVRAFGLRLVSTQPGPGSLTIDNLRLTRSASRPASRAASAEASPRIAVSFEDPVASRGGRVRLRITILNYRSTEGRRRGEYERRNGWGFDLNLPEGLIIPDGSLGGGDFNCAVWADPDHRRGESTKLKKERSALRVRDGVLPAGKSCYISVPVTAETAGVYRIEPTSFVNGNDILRPDGGAGVKFAQGAVAWNKIDALDRGRFLPGSTWLLTREGRATRGGGITEEPNAVFPLGSSVSIDETGASVGNPGTGTWSHAGDGADDGRFSLDDLPWGQYALAEQRPPLHYPQQPPTIYRFTISADGLKADGLSAPAVARGGTSPDLTNDQSVDLDVLSVKKDLQGRGWKPGDAFGFALTAESSSPDPGAFDAAQPAWGSDRSPMPGGAADRATVSVSCVAGTPGDSCAAVGFGRIRYARPGTYRYTLVEETPADPAAAAKLIYDTAARTVLVKVDYAKDGNQLLSVRAVKWRPADAGGGAGWSIWNADDAPAGTPAAVTFVNRVPQVGVLPLTGGRSGRDWLAAGAGIGVATLLAGASCAIWRRRRLI